MEPLGVIIGAALGSAGIGGLLAGAVQFSRSSRAARSIEQIKKSIDSDDDNSAGVTALRAALDRERVRLASIVVVGAPQAFLALLVAVIVSVILLIVIFANGLLPFSQDRDGDGVYGEVDSRFLWIMIIAAAGYIMLIAFTFDALIQQRRRRFIDDALAPGVDVKQLVKEQQGRRNGRRFRPPE